MAYFIKTLEEIFGPYWKIASSAINGTSDWHCRDMNGEIQTLRKDFSVRGCDLYVENKMVAQSPFPLLEFQKECLETLRKISDIEAHDPENEKLWLRAHVDSGADIFYVYCDGPLFYFCGHQGAVASLTALKRRVIVDLSLLIRLRDAIGDAWQI